MKFLKTSLLFMLILIVNIQAQVYRSPAYVRFIGNGYINQSPYFNTLEYALNNVKDQATSQNPYVFWIAGDTLRIPDWDSVFTESGLTLKDSIEIYYVNTGKIKWAGFGFGGGGSGGTVTIITQDDTTLYYGWPNWNQTNIALPFWQRELGRAFDEIDEEVWRLIVYTKFPLYIENDTLKIDTTGLGGNAGWTPLPDSLTVVRTFGNQTINNNKTFTGATRFNGTVDFSGNGNFQLPGSNIGGIAQPRRLWGVSSSVYYTGSGSDTSNVLFGKVGSISFTGTNSSLSITQIGVTSSSIIIATQVYSDSATAINQNDQLVIVPYTNGFHIKRGLSGTANLKVNWAWIKQ